MRLSAGSGGEGTFLGEAEEDLPVQFAGEPLTVAFNATYLTDGLAVLNSERVHFGFTTSQRPAVLQPADKDQALDEGEGPYPAQAGDYRYLLRIFSSRLSRRALTVRTASKSLSNVAVNAGCSNACCRSHRSWVPVHALPPE